MLCDEDVRRILVERIERHRSGVGIVVGIVEPHGSQIVSAGRRSANDDRPLDGDTVFNTTCLVKLFTALLLCDMAQRGELRLTDPVSVHLPPTAPALARSGAPVTLIDLATHTSGLPAAMRAATLEPAMYAAFPSVEQMYRSLAAYVGPPATAQRYTYSTLGMQLLAHALSVRACRDYEALLESRICAVVGMPSTRVTPGGELADRLAIGHNERLLPVSDADVVLPGASQLFSTANDLIAFVRAYLGHTPCSLSAPMAAMLSVRRPTYRPEMSVALGWHIVSRADDEIVWHHGLGRGYRSFLGACRHSGIGVIVLSNAATGAGVHDIGLHLLDPAYALHPADARVFRMPDRYVAASIDPAVYDEYAGLYQLTPRRLLRITRDGDRLLAQWAGDARHEIVPRSQREFFYNVDEADISPYTTLTFEADGDGRVVGLTVHNLSHDLRLVRIEAQPQPVWFGQRLADVGPDAHDAYAGRYAVGATVVTITPEGDRLYLEAAGGERIELLPFAPHLYFYRSDVVDAHVAFELHGGQRATGIVLLSNGVSERGDRVDEPTAGGGRDVGHVA